MSCYVFVCCVFVGISRFAGSVVFPHASSLDVVNSLAASLRLAVFRLMHLCILRHAQPSSRPALTFTVGWCEADPNHLNSRAGLSDIMHLLWLVTARSRSRIQITMRAMFLVVSPRLAQTRFNNISCRIVVLDGKVTVGLKNIKCQHDEAPLAENMQVVQTNSKKL